MPETTPALTAAIARAVADQRGDTIRLLQDFVSLPSVTGDEAAMQFAVNAAFTEAGLEVAEVEATPELIAPYCDHVGEETRFANRPNVVGTRRGAGRWALDPPQRPRRHRRERRPGDLDPRPARRRGRWAICSTAAAPAT